MEVFEDLTPVLGGNLIRLDSARMKQLQCPEVYKAIDKMGELSAKAMRLNRTLTNSQRIIDNPDQTIYVMWENREEQPGRSYILGMVKVGRKQLFLYDKNMRTYQGKVRCVLDFYVHHTVQRKGYGHQLFEFMLQSERVGPHQLALDNPSVTLLAFVSKFYNLDDPIWQNTNFVVFPSFFDSANGPEAGGRPAAPEGWSRLDTPRKLDGGANETRWIGNVKESKVNALSSTVVGELTTEGTLANRAAAAKNRKQHILSNNPLW